ncbi:uncharacterized protein LOC142609254 [Castanea sativa]|uniref:uncharacterized protein LOC142609254 n=1 Tax=Castanea sativa TaxID=21020 RepID=UPI003F64AE05
MTHAFWKQVWRADVPGKIKHFTWKACSNALPTRENLMQRKIIAKSSCQQCKSQSKSVFHALWDCASIQQVWESDFGWVDRQKTSTGSFQNLVELITQKPCQLELFITIAWFLWSRRNKLRLKEEALPQNRVVFEAKRYLILHQQPVNTLPKKQSQANETKWKPPDFNSFKTNFDGAMLSDRGEAGLGVVICNHEGEIIAAPSEKFPQPPSVICLEILAARCVAIFVHEVGLH